MNIGTIIIEQLGGGMFQMMTGAKNFLVSDKGLKFRLPSKFAKNGINSVVITLQDDDTYKMDFNKIWGSKIKEISSFSGIYFDMLQSIFTDETGLDTRI